MATSKVNISDFARYEFSKKEEHINKMREDFNEIFNALNENKVSVDVYGKFQNFAPSIQFVKLDALKKEDYPHNIDRNSIYIDFKIDLLEKKVEVFSYGHIYLSQEESRKTHLAMCGMKDLAVTRGVKWFRKQSYKNTADLVKKLNTFYLAVMEKVKEYTKEYPYKQGIGFVNPKFNQTEERKTA